ncbi:hypothetical protein [Burkholderia stabilis]|uniref:hypothetical protein n=1 Tax=Burkholderia stabilis TaxID=95485 RepID=UPI001F4A972C|nr:hypothetical protein [Burkholderia stabilis]
MLVADGAGSANNVQIGLTNVDFSPIRADGANAQCKMSIVLPTVKEKKGALWTVVDSVRAQ